MILAADFASSKAIRLYASISFSFTLLKSLRLNSSLLLEERTPPAKLVSDEVDGEVKGSSLGMSS